MAEASSYESILFSGNSVFIEELRQRYLDNPASVSSDWQQFFASMGLDSQQTASWAQERAAIIGQIDADAAPTTAKPARDAKPAVSASATPPAAAASGISEAMVQDTVRALQMIHAYRVRGHLLAKLDPLGLEPQAPHPELDPRSYGFEESDYAKPILLNGVLGLDKVTVGDVIARLRDTYCQHIGVEFMHIQHPDQKQWIQEKIESSRATPSYSAAQKKSILQDLIEVEAFEEFLQTKYPGMKRFSIQGGDAMVAGLEVIIEKASELGVEEIVIGMPHRGRMNVLTTIMGKPYSELLSIFHGNLDFPDSIDSSGDVKYHLGASHDRVMEGGKNLHLSLTANPSHLEIVNPVVCGKVRAKQDQHKDEARSKVMALTLHGDAAFAGQGSVPETLSLAELKGYRTGGTIHFIVNNQIGFTTAPKFSRFTPYPSDVAKMIQAPIFHVNGDDAEAVAYCCELATEFRQTFKRDVVVDMFCYRKYGHNEGDEPMFTQPLMYKAIAEKSSPAKIYATQLLNEGVMSDGEIKAVYQQFNQTFEAAFESGKGFIPNKANWLEGKWAGMIKPDTALKPEVDTGVAEKTLLELARSFSKIPSDFNANRKIERIYKARLDAIEEGKALDWSAGEALAFASLLKEGYPVRLSGQDSERGTFAHRHSVLTDQDSEGKYTPLNYLGGKQGRYEVINSSLSELAILGFEYGYTLAEPDALTIWEAQFGDFSNGAQMVIDQFICSGEIKWLRMSGLVMFLPHGYEGQGPEHSSARLERYLQLCGEDNMQVANCTTPANLFHILRRQLHRPFRKPLVLMTPKSLLRHKLCTSPLKDFLPKTTFKRVIPEIDKLVADKDVKRLIFCSGKVYYDLLEARRAQESKDIALVRIEQYYPFPAAEIAAELKRYSNAEVLWVQEEPKNMGAWTFIRALIEEVMDELGRGHERVHYVGRKIAASPAAGYLKIHTREQQALVSQALTLQAPAKKAAAPKSKKAG